MGIVLAMGFFFIFVTMVFVVIAVFFPEWLGITGKKAKEIIAAQENQALKNEAKNEPSEDKNDSKSRPKDI